MWNLFQTVILEVAKVGKKELNFSELMEIIRKVGQVYDNRTAKNYIDCMIDNNWLIQKSANPLDVLGSFVVTSVYKYKSMTWKINETAKFDSLTKEDVIKQLTT